MWVAGNGQRNRADLESDTNTQNSVLRNTADLKERKAGRDEFEEAQFYSCIFLGPNVLSVGREPVFVRLYN